MSNYTTRTCPDLGLKPCGTKGGFFALLFMVVFVVLNAGWSEKLFLTSVPIEMLRRPDFSFASSLNPSVVPAQPLSSTSCSPLPTLNYTRLAVNWGTTAAHTSQAASQALELFGCPLNRRSFIRAVFLLAKDVTERDAGIGFHNTQLGSSPTITAPSSDKAPFLSFFLTSESGIAKYFRSRLDRLLDHGDRETHADFAVALEAFIVLNPAWRNTTTSYISLLANPRLRRAMISRVQITGLCFLHAPLVALHYAVNLQSVDLNNQTVDITTALRHNFDGVLGSYLFADKGAIVIDVIRSVFAPDPGVLGADTVPFGIYAPSSAPNSKRDYYGLIDMLKSFGVGIVNSFRVYDRFWNASATSFSGSNVTGFRGGHAMVLIGVRLDVQSGQYYLLLQNWWHALQVVEVRQDYAYACSTSLVFVSTPQMSYRKNWITAPFRSAESAAETSGVAFPMVA